MEQDNLEEFLTPITPTKQRSQQRAQPQHKSPTVEHQLQTHQPPPDSPSKAQARSRLGSLLGQIRKGDDRNGKSGHQREDAFDDEIGGLGKRGPGRPRKREKRVIFELRGKPFGLRDSGQPESIYALCRKWMYGKDDDLPPSMDEEANDSSSTAGEGGGPNEFDIPRFKSLDLMATREIHALPLPRYEVPLMDPRPQKVLRAPESGIDPTMAEPKAILGEHKKHWKNVKKNWMNYNQKRQQRYSDSLQLLRTVHGIAQQTQI